MSTFTIEDCLEICNKFCKIIEKSFGPRGELSFIMSCTGQGQFTTSGMTIMEKIQPLHHPVARIILQTLQKYHDSAGDGSKTFILLLHEIFVQISKYKKDSSFTNDVRIKLMCGFSNLLLHNILSDCFVELRHKISKITRESMIRQDDMFTSILNLLRTFFCGKFSFSISDCLCNLVFCLLVKHSKTFQSASLGIKHTIDNFSVLCSVGEGNTLSESQILPGVVLSREFAVFSNSKTTKHSEKFMIINNPTNETLNCSFSIRNKQQIYTLVENEFHKLQMLIEQKKQKEVSLLICTGKVSDSIKGLCKEYNIKLITLVPEEEVNYLLRLSQIQPVSSLADKVSNENCGMLDFIRTVRIRNKDYAHLGLKFKESNCFPYHLILNGPSDRICKQYLKEVWNSLKLISLWKKDSDRHSQELLKDDIKGDHTGNLPLTDNYVKNILQNNVQQITSPNKLDSAHLFEHANAEWKCINLKHLSISKGWPNFLICPAGGYWELCLYHILCSKTFDNRDLAIACRILSKSLIVIPRTLYANNSCKQSHFPCAWKLITEKLQLNKLCYLDERGEVQTIDYINRFEPIIAKEMLINQVIQLVVQLLRLQSVISMNK